MLVEKKAKKNIGDIEKNFEPPLYINYRKKFDKEKVQRVIEKFKKGEIVVVFDDEKRENEADLVLAGEFADYKKIDFIISKAKGLLCVAISKDIALQKGLELMGTNKLDKHSTAFTISIDSVKCKTGISPIEREITIKELVDENTTFKDFVTPGHIFPLIAKDNLLLERMGHTEASITLTKLAFLKPVAVICELTGDNGNMMNINEAIDFATQNELEFVTVRELKKYYQLYYPCVTKEASSKLFTRWGDFQITVYKEVGTEKEHILLTKGDYRDGPVRIHSECFTGDIFHSLTCDCRLQLEEALEIIKNEGRGAIIYLRQEGRGIGLANKIKAYNLQQTENLDTVEANLKLGFLDDERDFSIAGWILKDAGFNKSIKVITGNPDKLEDLKLFGFEVEQITFKKNVTEINKNYLKTKEEKFNHIINWNI